MVCKKNFGGKTASLSFIPFRMTGLIFKRLSQYYLPFTCNVIHHPKKTFSTSTQLETTHSSWRSLIETPKQQTTPTTITVASKIYSTRRTWSNHDTERLLQLVKKYGNKWKVFTHYFPGRTAFCIRSHYFSVTHDTTRWTLEEKKILQQQLGTKADPDKIDWETIRANLPKQRTTARIKQFWQNSIQPTLKRGSWTEEETEQLKALVSEYGTNWELISKKIDTRSEDQCRNKWAYEITTTKRGEFSKDEDEALKKAVEKYGIDEFHKIKQEMDSQRSISQLRTRYNNFLDPDVDRSPWTKEEKALAIKLFQELKNIRASVCLLFLSYSSLKSIMKRGVTYIITLVSIGLLYFGSLYVVSRPSKSCFNLAENDQQGVDELDDQYTTVEIKPSCKKSPSDDKKEKAVIVILVRNSELAAMRRTLRQFEDRFNRKYNYPYVFLNDEPFSEEFKYAVSVMTNAEIKFGLVPTSMWSVPDHVNETVMNSQLADYAARNIMYGGSLSYRHMCRFNSGFFYRHPLLAEYDYYWRVEPDVSFFCDLDYDPFKFLKDNSKEYGFTITLKEIPETIPSLWEHTLKFAHQQGLNTTLLRFFGSPSGGYNLCHYWSNFEIASLNLWRDDRYQKYFDYLDNTGNFFYERWGDAIVHSLAAGLFLNKSQVHFFNDIGYKHDDFSHCVDDGIFGNCMCPDNVPNFDYSWGSCLSEWKSYAEEGHQWDFRKNGDQYLEGVQVFQNPGDAAIDIELD
ncbi:glycolipid 2-alpha-mannosyltransferase-domain-containing protein [Parasitella parasitica]|nr:glycolipid 2-alpha-mannosyltransferase-domain-containing protein [Parasitella parasitica]